MNVMRLGLWAALLLAAALMFVLPGTREVAAQNAVAGVNGLNVKTVRHASGIFRVAGPKQWIEEGDKGGTFYYVEEKRDESSVVLLDPGRNFRIRVDLRQRQILLSADAAPFSPLYAITGVSPALTPGRTSQQKCNEAVQGKVAWDRAGNKNWTPENLRLLCATTTLVDSTVECFEKEIRSHGDWQRGIDGCTAGRHQLEVLYVIPKGQHPRPDAERALEAAMAVIQRHFFQQLGVTFQLKTPLVRVVAINEGVEELQGDAMGARAQKLADNGFKSDYAYKENVIVAVFEGLNIGLGLGGNNIASIPGDFWQPVYEMFRKAPSDLHKVGLLHGWSHELGHAFGLAHTEDARKCFAKFGVDLGKLPSLIMQKTEDRPTLYDYPFIPEEKRLLLDETYYPSCRGTGDRPHASWHLRHPLPRDNPAIARPAAPAAPAAPAGATANGRDVKAVRHAAGAFRLIGPKRWIEEDGKGATKFSFAEESRDDASVVLFDPARDYRVRLDHRQRQILLAVGTSQFSPLYAITEASSTEGRNSTSAAP